MDKSLGNLTDNHSHSQDMVNLSTQDSTELILNLLLTINLVSLNLKFRNHTDIPKVSTMVLECLHPSTNPNLKQILILIPCTQPLLPSLATKHKKAA